MSKIIKAPFKAVKKVFKTAKKIFKKVVSSSFGKILMFGAAIYTGGVALGAWGQTGPLSNMFNAFGTSTISGATAATPTAITSAAPALAGEIATAAPLGTAAVGGAIPTAIQAPGFLSSIGSTLGKVGAYAEANPMLAQMALQGISTALTPDQIDIMEEEERIRRSRFEGLNDVGRINLSGLPTGGTLQSMGGIPWHERLRRAGGR